MALLMLGCSYDEGAFGWSDVHFAGALLCYSCWRDGVVLGTELGWPGHSFCEVCASSFGMCVILCEDACVADDVLICVCFAAWRRH